MEGTSGTAALRFALETAIARSLPERTLEITEGTLVNAESTWPPMTSEIAAAIPLYGTCKRSMPASVFSISPSRWLIEPLPEEA